MSNTNFGTARTTTQSQVHHAKTFWDKFFLLLFLVAHFNEPKLSLKTSAFFHKKIKHRYQTEGSRGAVKDRSGNGFPIVKLLSYDRPATLQIFIGTDVGRVAPHMFYQACKVSGKNSTPCNEKKVEGTIVIEIELKPENDMTATCDCVGILKVSEAIRREEKRADCGELWTLNKNSLLFNANFIFRIL